MRKVALLALLAGSVAYGAPSASACHITQPLNPRCHVHSAAFTGTTQMGCFGCPGPRPGTASLSVTSGVVINGSAHADYTAVLPADTTCIISGTATGNVTGAVNVNFNWVRLGAVAVITTTGDINGAGVATFVITSPVGNPCGGPITAQVAGAVAGT
ncbi:MAG TPA: hypothetical protein VNQ77_07250 [Frankiaceae bacterium]|nr:hypothetical protein [Frankiaceae bacterium]